MRNASTSPPAQCGLCAGQDAAGSVRPAVNHCFSPARLDRLSETGKPLNVRQGEAQRIRERQSLRRVPMTIRHFLAAAALALGLSQPVSGAALYAFTETGGDVVGILSGQIDTSDLSPEFVPKFGIGVSPNIPALFSGPDGDIVRFRSVFITAPLFGTLRTALATSSTGDIFVLDRLLLGLPAAYTSSAPLTGSLTFANATFASLGITPGEYVYTLTNDDTVTLRFGAPTPIPLPAAAPLLLSGLAGLVLLRRRARKAAARHPA
jgi:hypothetical protein